MNPWFRGSQHGLHGTGQHRSSGPLRAYVTKVYYPAEDAKSPAIKSTDLVCDVYVMETGFRGPLYGLPILRQSGGTWDYEFWRPQEATISLDGEALKLEGDSAGTDRVVAFLDTNADLVVVDFLAGDINRPFIAGQFSRPRTKRGGEKAGDEDYRWRRHIGGNLVGVKKDGTLVVDISESSNGTAAAGGTEEAGTPKLEIVASNGKLTVTDGCDVLLEPDTGKGFTVQGGKGTFRQSSGSTNVQVVLLDETRIDVAAVLTEFLPVVTAAAAMFGMVLVNSAAIIPGLVAGAASTNPAGGGKLLKATNLESD